MKTGLDIITGLGLAPGLEDRAWFPVWEGAGAGSGARSGVEAGSDAGS